MPYTGMQIYQHQLQGNHLVVWAPCGACFDHFQLEVLIYNNFFAAH